MPYFLVGVIIVILVVVAARAFTNANPAVLARQFRVLGGTIALVLAAIFALMGRAFVAGPLAAMGFLLLMRNAADKRATPSGGGASEVRTEWLVMALDHDTGELDGVILKGAFEARRMSELSLEELKALLLECSGDDPSSAQLVESYLDRLDPEWRSGDTTSGDEHRHPHASKGAMSKEEAFEVLGIPSGSSKEDIIAAHRRLMKKVHPDQGGSDYFASKLNEARDVLLGSG